MGRHAELTPTPLDVRRTIQLMGLTGGGAWVLGDLLPGGWPVNGLILLGSIVLTGFLAGLGLLLVRGDMVALRFLVAIALPTLVWSVLLIARGSASHPRTTDAVFGAAVAVGCGLLMSRRRGGVPPATL